MNLHCIYGQDNDTYAFRAYPRLTGNQHAHQGVVPDMSGDSHEIIHRCGSCGELLSKWKEPLLSVIIKKRKHDLSITYDGVLIASEKFKSLYTEYGLSGLVFRELPDDPQFFSVMAGRVVGFDAERRKTRFLHRCQDCGRHESIVGATPVFLKEGCRVDDLEFVRTDLEFGSGDEKHPLIICGSTVAEVLLDAKLRGLELMPIG